MAALASITQADDEDGLLAAVHRTSLALGLDRVVLLSVCGSSLTHVLSADCTVVDPDALVSSAYIARLLRSPIPESMADLPGVNALGTGIGVSAPHGPTTAVLLLGRSSGDGEIGPDVLGPACLAVTYAADVLRRLSAQVSTLTERELECLAMVAAGASGKVAAAALGISARTFEKLVERARQRLEARTTPAAVIEAMRRGWISEQMLLEAEVRVRRRYGAG